MEYFSYALRTIRTSDYSYPGLFVRWTFRTTDYSYYGLFIPYVKYSHINCWCEKALILQVVCQMQVDLGARLVAAVAFGYCIGLPTHCNHQVAIRAVFLKYIRQFLIDLHQTYRHSSVPKNTSPCIF